MVNIYQTRDSSPLRNPACIQWNPASLDKGASVYSVLTYISIAESTHISLFILCMHVAGCASLKLARQIYIDTYLLYMHLISYTHRQNTYRGYLNSCRCNSKRAGTYRVGSTCMRKEFNCEVHAVLPTCDGWAYIRLDYLKYSSYPQSWYNDLPP